MAFFAIFKAMKRDQMLMEAILGKLLEAPEPLLNVTGIANRLNTDQAVVRHHLHLLSDKGWVSEAENGFWRLTNAGHDYLEGTPEQGISLKSLG
jgi:predicted transcriptional regulator